MAEGKDHRNTIDNLLWFLQERAKELKCIYRVEEIISRPDLTLAEICRGIVQAIPPGWQYPEACQASIILGDSRYDAEDLVQTPWRQSADIVVQDKTIGKITVYYRHEMPQSDDGPFLKEETKLLQTIAGRLSHYIMYQRMKHVVQEWQAVKDSLSPNRRDDWRVVLNLLRQTDKQLYFKISHKMLNHLCWNGIDEAQRLVQYYNPSNKNLEEELIRDSNAPNRTRPPLMENDFISDETFKIASDHLPEEEIFTFVQQRIQEDKLSFLVRALTHDQSLANLADAIRRYHRIAPEGADLPTATQRGVHAALIRRMFSEQVQYVDVAKNYVSINDFYELLRTVVFTQESRGKLGGKSAGLYLAEKIIRKSGEDDELLANVKVPKTWYVTSDSILQFMYHNGLEELVEQKYKDINQVKLEYPHVVQTFKNAHFPPEILSALSLALDDFGDSPIIVRSSSLLEDRLGAVFSGKYKSLFLANQGGKSERLAALCDAIAEVYASTFSPDAIEYRVERGLLDYDEEMGIMIQQVVGTKVGHYFMPAYAGVAFSRNEFRWSPRIKREDGLIRLVPGLGTRAVDRLSDDYPVLIAPGQPRLRVNVTMEESMRYSPHFLDVINLASNSFETISADDLLRDFGHEVPNFNNIVSIRDGDRLKHFLGLHVDFQHDHLLVTFEGLAARTNFIARIKAILKLLEEKLAQPVDIEFASDGKDFYLLQYRPQSSADSATSTPIPRDIDPADLIFTANKYISNGRVPEISHIVYVDPEEYANVSDQGILLSIGRAVGMLNKELPARKFILMGPGRWGSRGDVRLGVNVTYSDINNTAMLIEIARQKGNYVPDLSFGTHFFQDLVESGIRYLPLYPDEPGIKFNDSFLLGSPNHLAEIVPDFAHLSNIIRVINVPEVCDGHVVRVAMNADTDEAVAYIERPETYRRPTISDIPAVTRVDGDSQWRLQMAEKLASELDRSKFGVAACWVIGATKSATAGPQSDIDLILHFVGSDEQRNLLNLWLTAWNSALSEANLYRTGVRVTKMVDAQIITDQDIAQMTPFATMVSPDSDAARPLPIKHG